ncbi:carboxymuconolactone decarboxylase family protein [Streptomyces sp. 6N223]|uniref:carboxymuconolactone decarboxylase family protein n=1 Tax=Streptomyces sp. 6N223 TaxID=3457412 RepID=UPI003FCF1A3F
MTKRVYLDKQSPSVFAAMSATAAEIRARADDAGLSRVTLELVNVRVSQINACAYCLDLHSRRALAAGETPQRLAVLPAWRETELFTDVERAALEIAEAVTLVAGPGRHLPDADYDRLRQSLTDDQLSLLIWAAIAINAFNRVSILSRHPVPPRGAHARDSRVET